MLHEQNIASEERKNIELANAVEGKTRNKKSFGRSRNSSSSPSSPKEILLSHLFKSSPSLSLYFFLYAYPWLHLCTTTSLWTRFEALQRYLRVFALVLFIYWHVWLYLMLAASTYSGWCTCKIKAIKNGLSSLGC